VSSRAPDYLIRPILAVVLVVSALKMLQVNNTITALIAIGMGVGAAVLIFRGRRAALAAAATTAGPAPDLTPAT
jgi:hypothetical protein